MKAKLNLSDLTVVSFDTLGTLDADRGTIAGYQDTRCTGIRTGCNTNEQSLNVLTCPGGASDDTFCGSDKTNWWQDTCGDQYTCHNHSCHMTGAGCNCNYTEGACTYGVQETCAGWNPPCPI